MFTLSKKTGYALMALKHMDRLSSQELTTAKELCELYHPPFDVISRVLQQLAQNGLLVSVKGIGGGYRLKVPLKEIMFMELLRVIEGPFQMVPCLQDNSRRCDITQSCNVLGAMLFVNRKLEGLFQSLSVSEILLQGELEPLPAELVSSGLDEVEGRQ